LRKPPRSTRKFDYPRVAFDSIDQRITIHLPPLFHGRFRPERPRTNLRPGADCGRFSPAGITTEEFIEKKNEVSHGDPLTITVRRGISAANDNVENPLPVTRSRFHQRALPSFFGRVDVRSAAVSRRVPGRAGAEALKALGFEQQKRFPDCRSNDCPLTLLGDRGVIEFARRAHFWPV